jgi:HEPN domain-containing protein
MRASPATFCTGPCGKVGTSMPPSDFGAELRTAAERDLVVWRKLVADPEVHDAMLGFHAQQVVEKCLKSVLATAQVPFRRTHDLAELLDALTDAGLPLPPHADRLDELNPYAVEARYGMGGVAPLDRAAVTDWLADVVRWVDTN